MKEKNNNFLYVHLGKVKVMKKNYEIIKVNWFWLER